MASKLRAAGGTVELITFDGLDHYLEDAAARRRLLQDSDAFMRKATGR